MNLMYLKNGSNEINSWVYNVQVVTKELWVVCITDVVKKSKESSTQKKKAMLW